MKKRFIRTLSALLCLALLFTSSLGFSAFAVTYTTDFYEEYVTGQDIKYNGITYMGKGHQTTKSYYKDSAKTQWVSDLCIDSWVGKQKDADQRYAGGYALVFRGSSIMSEEIGNIFLSVSALAYNNENMTPDAYGIVSGQSQYLMERDISTRNTLRVYTNGMITVNNDIYYYVEYDEPICATKNETRF